MNKEVKIKYSSDDGLKLSGVFNVPNKVQAFALMCHGIMMDKNEWNNLHFRISQDLNEQNIGTFRFDYRGHGDSQGTMRDMTVAGEYLDVKSSIREINKKYKGEVSIIASSFGACSSILYAALFPEKINCLVLLNPVLDFDATFLHPMVDWTKDTFNEEGFQHLEKRGYILLDGHQLGAKLIAEFQIIKPYEFLKKIKCPVLVIHGDKDSMVPYKISKKHAFPNIKSKLISIKDADHGFVDWDDDDGVSEQSMINQKQVTKYIIEWIRKWGTQ